MASMMTPGVDSASEESRNEMDGCRRLTNIVWKVAKGVDVVGERGV